MARRALLLLALLVASITMPPAAAAAQDPDSTATTAVLSPQHIIPRPNSGTPPEDAGDRGGALQLGLLALLVVVIAGGVLAVAHQSRQARDGSEG
jgi:uncharacterized protein HemX